MPELTSVPSEDGAALKTVTFETTPIMSTYLVAIVIGNLSRVVDPDWIRIQRLGGSGSVLGLRIRIQGQEN
jgi:aminopeptidase N